MLSLLAATLFISSALSHEHHGDHHRDHDGDHHGQHHHGEHKPHHECTHGEDGHIKKGENLFEMNMKYKNHPYAAKKQEAEDALKSILDPVFPSKTSQDNEPSQERRRSLLESSEVQPIRISAYYDPVSILNNNALNSDDVRHLQDVVGAVIDYYEQMVSVIPVDGNWHYERPCNYFYYQPYGTNCASYSDNVMCQDSPVPDEHLADQLLYTVDPATATVVPGGVGVQDTDLMIYVSFYDTLYCQYNVLAHAGPCAFDQYGRPVAGNVNICQKFLNTKPWKQDVETMLHEISHITIMSVDLWDGFRDSNGDIMPFEDVYGYTADHGAMIISPAVRAAAKEHFGCTSNTKFKGVPLSSNYSSHWHPKYLFSETMNPTIYGGTVAYSLLTLALMEDSGWYLVNKEYAEPYYFAKDKGCNFWTTPDCVDKTTGISNMATLYCTSLSDNGCSADYAAPARCRFWTNDANIPTEYQYYPNQPTWGGFEEADWCSMRDPSDSQSNGYESICWDLRGNTEDSVSYGAETWSSTSRCTVMDNEGYCFEHTCNGWDAGLTQYTSVTITLSSTESLTCLRTDEGKKKGVNGKKVTCPVIDTVCTKNTNFGSCYFGHYSDIEGKCVCNVGYTGTDCNTENTGVDVEAVLAVSKSPTSAPTAAPDTLCFEVWDGYSASYNGEWQFTQLWNGYGAYVAPSGSRFLFWNIFSHYWEISKSVDGNNVYCRCTIEEFGGNLDDCSGNWYCYDGTAGDYVNKKNAITYYGNCATTTPAPTEPTVSCSDEITWSHTFTGLRKFRESKHGQGYLNTALSLFLDDNGQCGTDAASLDYYYDFTFTKGQKTLLTELIVCCGDGATFDGSSTPPPGFAAEGAGDAFAEDWEIEEESAIPVEAYIFGAIGAFLLIIGIIAIIAYKRYIAKKNSFLTAQVTAINSDHSNVTPKPDEVHEESVESKENPETTENVENDEANTPEITIQTEGNEKNETIQQEKVADAAE